MVIFQVGNTLERWSVGKTWKNLFFGGVEKKNLERFKEFQ